MLVAIPIIFMSSVAEPITATVRAEYWGDLWADTGRATIGVAIPPELPTQHIISRKVHVLLNGTEIVPSSSTRTSLESADRADFIELPISKSEKLATRFQIVQECTVKLTRPSFETPVNLAEFGIEAPDRVELDASIQPLNMKAIQMAGVSAGTSPEDCLTKITSFLSRRWPSRLDRTPMNVLGMFQGSSMSDEKRSDILRASLQTIGSKTHEIQALRIDAAGTTVFGDRKDSSNRRDDGGMGDLTFVSDPRSSRWYAVDLAGLALQPKRDNSAFFVLSVTRVFQHKVGNATMRQSVNDTGFFDVPDGVMNRRGCKSRISGSAAAL